MNNKDIVLNKIKKEDYVFLHNLLAQRKHGKNMLDLSNQNHIQNGILYTIRMKK